MVVSTCQWCVILFSCCALLQAECAHGAKDCCWSNLRPVRVMLLKRRRVNVVTPSEFVGVTRIRAFRSPCQGLEDSIRSGLTLPDGRIHACLSPSHGYEDSFGSGLTLPDGIRNTCGCD